jgi:predicted XRE-type DNA-binding protein
MNKRMIDDVEVEMSSGNVFADVGLPDADKLKIKSGLVIEITKALRSLGLSQEEAGRRMGLPQPKLSGLLRGDFSNVSERKLMDCLNRLGYDIEIKIKPASKPVGHLRKSYAVKTTRKSNRETRNRCRFQATGRKV